MLREIFKKTNPEITNKKIIIFNGIPPKKIYEHDADPKITIEEVKIYNNSLLRFVIDEDNLINEDYLYDSENIKKQQEIFDKISLKNQSIDNRIIDDLDKENESYYSKNKSCSDIHQKKTEGKNFLLIFITI
jgi:hypothetical protein